MLNFFLSILIGIISNILTHYLFTPSSNGETNKLNWSYFALNFIPITYAVIGLYFMPILAITLIKKILLVILFFALPFLSLIILNINFVKTWLCSKAGWNNYSDKRFFLTYLFGGIIFGIIIFQSLDSGLLPKFISFSCGNVTTKTMLKGTVTNPDWQVYVIFSPKKYDNLFVEKADLIGSSGEWIIIANFGGSIGEEFQIIAYALETDELPPNSQPSAEWIQKNYKHKTKVCIVEKI